MSKLFVFPVFLFSLLSTWPRVIHSVDVKIFNPYSIEMKLVVKCDWKEKRPKYVKEYILKKNSKILIPILFNDCQIHPRL